MAVVKVLEIIAQSDQGWEEAARTAVREASKTIRNIQNVYIEHFQGIVEGDKIVRYRVNVKVSFLVEDALGGVGGSHSNRTPAESSGGKIGSISRSGAQGKSGRKK